MSAPPGGTAGAAPGRRPGWFEGLGLLGVALYFLASWRLAPNHTDEGLLLGYVDEMSRGRLPFRDFVDAYGLLNWPGPVLGYLLAGRAVWGVRLWMVVLKTVTVALAYGLVRRTAAASQGDPESGGERHGVVAAGLMTVLLGAEWQSLQTPYAFLTVLPAVLGGWRLLLFPAASRPRSAAAAAAVIATAIWVKLNTGLYLLAGGLFTAFFWDGALRGGPVTPTSRASTLARAAAAAALYLAFATFVRRHVNVWFVLYLLAPLGVGLGFAVRATARGGAGTPLRDGAAQALRIGGTAGAVSLLVLLGYYGGHAGDYARELAGILGNIRYTAPFPPIGEPGSYVGLNDWYWLQLPWLVSALFVAWVALVPTGPEGGAGLAARRARTTALFVCFTLHAFVLYARSDETHVYQALVLAPVPLLCLVAELEVLLAARAPDFARALARGTPLGAVVLGQSLLVTPELERVLPGPGDWQSRRLAHLQFRREDGRYVRNFAPGITDREWDVVESEAAEHVRLLTSPGEELLLLTANRLMFLSSDTRPVGGRYHFYFYLAAVGLLDRRGFDRIVPPSVLEGILAAPPRVVVGAFGYVPLCVVFPELRALVETRYTLTAKYRHIWIYERREGVGGSAT
ncbi:MAG: hypothetical protein FJ104_01270 [Deltaproteobacteria bacterium]|nr:hypothetical protein [Deltaproteobacteria bacterium]